MTEPTFSLYEVGSVIVLRLPEIDQRYRMIHHEEPFMLYPGEVVREYVDEKGLRYCISNYCRVWSYKKRCMVKNIPNVYLPTWIKSNFQPEELDNNYTRFNIDVISPTNYYRTHKEERLAYQKSYRDNNLEKVRANEKKYRDANHDRLLAMAKARRDKRRAEMTEEEREAERAKRREYYRQRKERIANELASQGIEPSESNDDTIFSQSNDKNNDGSGDNGLLA